MIKGMMEMKSIQISRREKNTKNYRLLKALIIGVFLWIIAMLSPLVVDDYYFIGLQFNSFPERLNYVLHYGNGRVLGNLFALYMMQYPMLRYCVKALIFCLIGFFMTKIVDNAAGGENENIVFLLFIALAPQIFAQVYSWSSGFCNYAPPVLCFLYLAYRFLFSDKKMGWKDSIIVLLVGGIGELFVEHSALINFTLVCCIMGYCIKSKRNIIPGLFCWFGTLSGLLIIFLVPHFYTAVTGFENYQKLNLNDFHGLLISIVANTMQICEEYGAAVVLWIALSFTMLMRCRGRKNIIVTIILTGFPVYSGIYYALMRSGVHPNTILIDVINTVVTLGYLLAVLYVIMKINNDKIRVLSLALLATGVYSVLPLLVVYPIGARCLFHSYTAMAMLAAVNFVDITSQNNKMHNRIAGIVALSIMLILVGTYCKIYRIDEEKNNHIMACMEKGDKEICIPNISSDYIHSNENIMISSAYFYNKPGDISFSEIEYEDWLGHR